MINKNETNNDIDKVIVYQNKKIDLIIKKNKNNIQELEDRIKVSENLLNNLGINIKIEDVSLKTRNKVLSMPSWEELINIAKNEIKSQAKIESIFTDKEIKENEEYINALRDDFDSLHHLDEYDYMICAIGALIASLIDILLVGIPMSPTPDGIKAGSFANYIRKLFENKYGTDEIQKLANSYDAKVPYDLQHNILNAENMVDVQIKGLSSQYHRLLSLGHDPFLGFIIGVLDIMNGTITTIDKKGKFVRQVVKYKDLSKRIETDYIQAILKQINHLKTDVATEMSLPAPLMGLFNFLDLGEIEYVMNGGNGKGTIAEIIQQMYYNGFDFIHFCSQSISVAVLEIFVRVAYSIKRVKEGFGLKESIPELPPLKINKEKHPKIATMLFLSHSGAVAINSGKICFTKNPLSINYAEWMAFALYSFNQLKWVLIDKPMLRGNYVTGILNKEFDEAFIDIDAFVKNYSSRSIS